MRHTLAALPSAAALSAPAAVAVVATVLAVTRPTVAASWRVARAATVAMAAAAVVVGVLRVVDGERAGALVRRDDLTVAMLGLIALFGWVVVRYSATYLAGDPRERGYVGHLLATLAAVAVVVVANHLVVLVVAWAAASLALHGLLTFFGDRPVARAVAHKKFVLARVADACMVGATVAFAATFHTARIDAIGARAAAAASLPTGARVAILLVAVAAILKCALLPFHGWLIQVMEAPTPVSALLHAGVVNLGGFVLLRFAPVVDRAPATRTVLVVMGAATAVVAALVMTTRVSVKVALAWSTCAQMGFLLLQCGLGLWEMALVHLLAHSAYKAHAFLGAGGTVRRTEVRQLAAPAPAPTGASVVAGVGIAAVATAAVAAVWASLPGVGAPTATVGLMLGVVALALVPLTTPSGDGGGVDAARFGRAAVVPVVYLGLHELAGRLVPHGEPAPVALLVVVGLAFAGLFVVRTACLVAPAGPVPQRIRPWLYAGFFLDDAFTRVVFAVSPPPPAACRPEPLPRPAAVTVVGPAPL